MREQLVCLLGTRQCKSVVGKSSVALQTQGQLQAYHFVLCGALITDLCLYAGTSVLQFINSECRFFGSCHLVFSEVSLVQSTPGSTSCQHLKGSVGSMSGGCHTSNVGRLLKSKVRSHEPGGVRGQSQEFVGR
eukprot:scaffold57576_cov18-Tisochrysis_lutea.AAC.2